MISGVQASDNMTREMLQLNNDGIVYKDFPGQSPGVLKLCWTPRFGNGKK